MRSRRRCGCGKSTAARSSSARRARARVAGPARGAGARRRPRHPCRRRSALGGADAFVVAAALAEAMRDEQFDLVLTGLQSDDQGSAQTGVILAERLGLPHATIVMDVQVDGRGAAGEARARRRLVPVGRDAAAGRC